MLRVSSRTGRALGRVVVFFLLLGGAALAGCGSAGADSAADTQVQSLWADRAPHAGDNSRVIAVAHDAGFGPLGTYSVRLQTAAPPYAVTVSYDQLDKSFESIDFTSNATLLLALVGNLDRVDVTSQGAIFTLTSKEASTRLGYDVKALSRDRQRLATYLRMLHD